jgi:hypothetical protein
MSAEAAIAISPGFHLDVGWGLWTAQICQYSGVLVHSLRLCSLPGTAMLSWLIGLWLASSALIRILRFLGRVYQVPGVSVPTHAEPDCDARGNHNIGTLTCQS